MNVRLSCWMIRALMVVPFACGGSAATGPAPAAAPAPAATAPKQSAGAPAPATAAARGSAPAAAPKQRFDLLVREDFFAGVLHHDAAALDRAMATCDKALAKNPDHPQAHAWHGAGLIARASFAFQKGDRDAGMKLWNQGMAEMDHAVELAPDSVGTRIPRGAVLLATAPYVPQPHRNQLLDKALGDYQHAMDLQADTFDQLPLHARSMLLYGLADGWARRGDAAKARSYYQRLAAMAPRSKYGQRAQAYLDGDTTPKPMACGGCHAR